MTKTQQTALVFLALALLLSPPVLAQESAEPTLLDQISEQERALSVLSNLIRWSGVVTSIFSIVAAALLLRFVRSIGENLSSVFIERRMFIHKIVTFLQFGIYLVTGFSVIFLSFKVSAQLLAIIGGTIALAVGFALKDVASSIIAGITIMFDRPFQVGDRVLFGDQYGDVTKIGLRSVKLQTLHDSTVTIPNNIFLTNVVSCGNYGVLYMQVVVDFHIGLDQDAALARDLIREATAISRFVYLPNPIVVLVSQVITENYLALRLRLKAYVFDTQYEKKFVSDVTMRVMEAFRLHRIQPPVIIHRSVVDRASAVEG